MAAIGTEQRRDQIASELAAARRRTLELIEPLGEEQLNRQYSPILSPLIWDLGHIANFEELWLVQRVGGLQPLDGALGRLYDAIEQPRAGRAGLPILHGEGCLAYLEAVRARTLEVLEKADLSGSADPVIRDGFVYELILAHERQHNETMLQLIQMIDGYPAEVAEAGRPAAPGRSPGMASISAGEHEIGDPGHGFAYDNERPRHRVSLGGFEIDRRPVTAGEFAEFLDSEGGEPPKYWEADGSGGWASTRYGRRVPIERDAPVIHVDCAQAEAFARWAGKRLPTEFEWEAATAAGSIEGIGQVWEWTASEFGAYPGFEAFPYREYSEVFFGEGYRVLRGAAWATHPSVARITFRNWDLVERSQIFSGFRCARDG